MSNANANSSKTSAGSKARINNGKLPKTNNLAKQNLENQSKMSDLKIVGGQFNIEGNELIINPENTLDFSPLNELLSKSVGTFNKVLNKNGKIVKRIDQEKGIEYVITENDIIKAIKQSSYSRKTSQQKKEK